jgi:hypothetical protein
MLVAKRTGEVVGYSDFGNIHENEALGEVAASMPTRRSGGPEFRVNWWRQAWRDSDLTPYPESCFGHRAGQAEQGHFMKVLVHSHRP